MSNFSSDEDVITLTEKLQHSQLVARDLALKSRREATILKRLISRLITASQAQDEPLINQKLAQIQRDLDAQEDVGRLIPQLALVERMVNKHTHAQEKAKDALENQFLQSGETLKCLPGLPGLPAQLKRDLRNLIQRPEEETNGNNQKIIALLQLYERAIKLLSLPSNGLTAKELLNIDRINQLAGELQHLVTELDFDGEVGDRLLDIRNRLLLSPDAQTLLELTLESVQLLLEGTRNERKASQTFLNQLNEDLSVLQRHNGRSIDTTQTIATQRTSLNEELALSVDEMHIHLNEAISLEDLRPNLSKVSDNLASIVARNKALEEREQQLLEQLQHNEQKLNALYTQTMDYRRRLGDQERKLLLDPLTKVYNRAALDDRLEHEYRCWLRYQSPFCLAMIDIDHFKSVNDQYGHLVGDKVLKVVARTIHQCLRDTDFIARFGGEEFVVLLPDAEETTRTHILDNIRETVARLPFKFKNKRLTVTVSIGASMFMNKDNTVDVLERADSALYNAKHNGRNKLVWAQ
ncbi:GGDEF domain-containing protein [Enterovibrio nigricans]|uniref:diguanylate cyclase n=1 Tax=Enterovibrio nigricans DSM 22720 TaxID=1121868 RepID=A0A1T4UBX8_9GAMM|nr:diguanylate cyclase [Enterovibrio nigricans]PKF51488.1 GGDEF domain-containing protein [Enterovibrio nigricans]SKA50193.1 diguanylate cyclase (GGDEF) domain-containing protein [Enterovibrio nigricans DSM 22720]